MKKRLLKRFALTGEIAGLDSVQSDICAARGSAKVRAGREKDRRVERRTGPTGWKRELTSVNAAKK